MLATFLSPILTIRLINRCSMSCDGSSGRPRFIATTSAAAATGSEFRPLLFLCGLQA